MDAWILYERIFSVQTQAIFTIVERRHVENQDDKLHLNRTDQQSSIAVL